MRRCLQEQDGGWGVWGGRPANHRIEKTPNVASGFQRMVREVEPQRNATAIGLRKQMRHKHRTKFCRANPNFTPRTHPNLTLKPLKPNLAAQAPPPAVRSYSNCTDVYHELPEAVTQQNQKGVTFPNTVEQTQAAVAITGGERAHGIFNAAPRCPRRHNGILEVRSWTAAQYNCGDHLFTLERCEMASAGRGCDAEERTPAMDITPAHSPHTDS